MTGERRGSARHYVRRRQSAPAVQQSAVRRANARSIGDCAADGSQPPPPGLYLDPDLAPNGGVADGIGRVTAAIGEGDKLWRQSGAANDAHEAPDNKDKGTDEQQ